MKVVRDQELPVPDGLNLTPEDIALLKRQWLESTTRWKRIRSMISQWAAYQFTRLLLFLRIAKRPEIKPKDLIGLPCAVLLENGKFKVFGEIVGHDTIRGFKFRSFKKEGAYRGRDIYALDTKNNRHVCVWRGRSYPGGK